MERFIATQTKTNETFSESISLLISRVDTMATHQKTMDTQITQQVSHLSQPQGYLSGQPETNPRGHPNAISTMGEGLKESPVIVLLEIAPVLDSAGIQGKKREENLSSAGEPSPPPPPPTHTY